MNIKFQRDCLLKMGISYKTVNERFYKEIKITSKMSLSGLSQDIATCKILPGTLLFSQTKSVLNKLHKKNKHP